MSPMIFFAPSGAKKPKKASKNEKEEEYEYSIIIRAPILLYQTLKSIFETIAWGLSKENYFKTWIFLFSYLFFSIAGTVITIFLATFFIDLYDLSLHDEVTLNLYYKVHISSFYQIIHPFNSTNSISPGVNGNWCILRFIFWQIQRQVFQIEWYFHSCCSEPAIQWSDWGHVFADLGVPAKSKLQIQYFVFPFAVDNFRAFLGRWVSKRWFCFVVGVNLCLFDWIFVFLEHFSSKRFLTF